MAIYNKVNGTMKRIVDFRFPTKDSGGNDVDQFASVYQGENLVHQNIVYETADGVRHILAKRLGANDEPFYNKGLNPVKVLAGSTQGVNSLEKLFAEVTTVTDLPILETIDTSNVNNMSTMFDTCTGLSNIDVSHFDTSNLVIMRSMFYGCSSLTSLDLSSFDTSKVIGMQNLFANCSSLRSVNLTGLDTRNVQNIDSMFNSCSSLTSLDLSSFDTSKVTTMNYMFYGCSSLTSLDLSSFDTSNVTSMISWISYCRNITSFKVSEAFFNAAARETSPLDKFDFSGLSAWVNVEEITALLNCLPSVTSCMLSFSVNTKNVITTNALEAIATNKGWTIS